MKEEKHRQRCIELDAGKVRHFAAGLGITNTRQLDTRFRTVHDVPPEREVSVVEKGWNGGCVDRKPALLLAQCLGLPDFVPLLKSPPGGGCWATLVDDPRFHADFLRFVPRRDDDSRLVRLGSARDDDRLDRVPVNTSWCLQLRGRKGEAVFILLRSEQRFFQLAPICGDGFANTFDGRTLRYPLSEWLEFEAADGVGWRQFIAVRARALPIMPRQFTTGFECTLEELELFAHRLLCGPETTDVKVDIYEFMLI